MPSASTPSLHPSRFSGEVYFAKSDDYIRGLTSLQIGSPSQATIELRDTVGDAQLFEALAAAAQQAELSSAEPLLALPLLAFCDEGPEGHRLNWLNLTERKTAQERRKSSARFPRCHEWYVTLEDDNTVRVTFEHGEFGYRRETFDRWSAAFARMSQLLAGRISWRQFGDPESRRTLLGKGQFYWQEPKARELVPVDNFVFVTQANDEITIAGVSHRCAITLHRGDESASEWHDDYALGLHRIADLLEQNTSVADFGMRKDNLEAYMASECSLEGGKSPAPAPPREIQSTGRGRCVVKSIYRSGDVWEAPVLVYATAEGAKVQLEHSDDGWTVRCRPLASAPSHRTFPEHKAPEALRALAQALQGDKFPSVPR